MQNRFKYASSDSLLKHSLEFGYSLPWAENVSCLFTPINIGSKSALNRFFIHPMEGFDAQLDGSPGELTNRRYSRFAQGGSGLICVEAVSVSKDGRSNPHQLYMHKKNFGEFGRLNELIKMNGHPASKIQGDVITNIQLTHSGKYSDPSRSLDSLTDDDLKRIRDEHVQGAIWAEKAGFDLIDMKVCHGYLLHQLLSAWKRKDSVYGGEGLEDRMLLIKEIIQGIAQSTRITISIRLNVFDGLSGGFGSSREDGLVPDLAETRQFIADESFKHVELWSVTAGIPYVNPWVTRPFDIPAVKGSEAPEHPLQGIIRMIELTKEVKKASNKPVIGAGLSWLRQYFSMVSAGIIEKDFADAVGMGRMAFAYPDLPKDLFDQNVTNAKKVCVTCSGCTQRMRAGLPAGCIIRDREIYEKE